MYGKEPKRVCTGFANLGLILGDEVQIIRGVTLYAKPHRVVVLHEYDKYIWLDMEFKVPYEPDRTIRTCMNKADMLAGDAALRRVYDGKVFTGKNVGVYEWL